MSGEKIEINPIDVAVMGRDEFDSDGDFDEYLNANWPGVIIHNLYVQSVLLGQVIGRIDRVDKRVDNLRRSLEDLAEALDPDGIDGEGYNKAEVRTTKKTWGH